MKDVKALIITGFGLNCDNETAHAFELAGAQPHRVHINELISGEVSLADFHILAFGGGFSWGDDHGAGVILALKLKKHIGKDLLQFIEDGKLIIGICNGFQALANLGLLPGLNGSYTDRSVSITYNDTGFRDHWVKLAANENSPCVFTKELGVVDYPIRHGEGKVIADADVIKGLVENNQVVFQYANEDGSVTLRQQGLRILRGLEPAEAETLLDAWTELWAGALQSHRIRKTAETVRDGDTLIWTLRDIA